MAPEKSNRRLGRGLDALFGASNSASLNQSEPESPFKEIQITEIAANPFQPRKNFKPADLRELQDSLSASGLLQPIAVRLAAKGVGYELIAGERRLRAATNLGWKTIQAVVKDLNDQEMLTLALVENLQRTDLNPIEEANGYSRLIDQFGHTQQTVATMVGKDRTTIANVLRILQLPADVRQFLQNGQLSAGQARPLLALEDKGKMSALARQIVAEGFSAREVEKRVRAAVPKRARKDSSKSAKSDEMPPAVKNIEQKLRKYFQTDVSIALGPDDRGSIAIAFYSPDELQRVLEIIGFSDNPQ